MDLRQSTAGQVISLGQFLDSTDGDTEENGLTIANTDIKIRKDGATTLANKTSGGATNISNGVYHATLDATDTSAAGLLEVYVHVAGALSVKAAFDVLTATAYDAKYTGTYNNFDASSDAVANVTLTATTTTNTDMRGTDSAATAANLATVDSNVDSILVDTGTTIPAQITALNDVSAAQVNAEMVDVLTVDTFAEPSSVPSSTSSIKDKLSWLFMLGRNKITQTSTVQTVRNDGDTSTVATSNVSDDGSTTTRDKYS